MRLPFPVFLTGALAFLVCNSAGGAPRLEISVDEQTGGRVKWKSEVPPIVGAEAEYNLLESSNLATWLQAAEPIKTVEAETIEVPFTKPSVGESLRFFRLQRNVTFGEVKDAGADALGFSAKYAAELNRLGEINTTEFSSLYPSPSNYLEQISFNPTQARFWSDWNTDPIVYNETLPAGTNERRSWDFRLNEQELATFKKLGFVVSERLSTPSFGAMMYRIYNDDLPVFISTDAILQAWHRSYSSMLQELEETYFYREWIGVLEKMADGVSQLSDAHPSGTLRPSILDADYFIAVALSLGKGTNVPSKLNQDARVAETLEAVTNDVVREFPLFGSCRRVDFSQFKPRGHYTESIWLSRYFQMLMWLGRIEFRITPAPADPTCNLNDPSRELASSALLYFLLKESQGFESWALMNAVINVFVGEPDSMNFAQLGELLKAAQITDVSDLLAPASFSRLNEMLLAGNLGVQEIMSDTYDRPGGKLPRTFTVFGQRFVPDSWALGKVVFDNIRRNGAKQFRYLPLSLDVAFGTLGNNATVPQIIAQIQDSSGHAARDGFQYQHNLAAVRNVLDSQPTAFWNQNIYNGWLGALRTLSEPTTSFEFPQSVRTRAWAMKTVNTQLGSWTHLRHDTVLYAKQSYSSAIICSYPKAYVEPVPKFWAAMKIMISNAAEKLAQLNLADREYTYNRFPHGWPVEFNSKAVQSNQVTFLRSFAARMEMLGDIARRELAHEELTENQVEALQNIVEVQRQYEGLQYSGWYPGLFYRSCFFGRSFEARFYHQTQGCDRADFIVTDVHTAPPPNTVGPLVLHQAVGKVNFLLIAVDCGEEEPIVYGGPVLSHFELPTPGLSRMTDGEWAALLGQYPPPTATPWTSEYLVPQR